MTSPPHLEQTFQQALKIIQPNFHMGWDLFLALIPLVLAIVLFQPNPRKSGWLHWPLFGLFILFLPNASYVLTDVIHFADKIRVTPPLPLWAVSLLLIEFILYFFIGLQSFTLSLMLWGRRLKQQHRGWLILPLEILVLSLSAFGMYLGRFDRFNSWDLVTDPEALMDHALAEIVHQRPQMITVIFFGVTTMLFYLIKFGNLMVCDLLGKSRELNLRSSGLTARDIYPPASHADSTRSAPDRISAQPPGERFR